MHFPSFAVSAFLCLAAISNEEQAHAFAPSSSSGVGVGVGAAYRSVSNNAGVMGNSREQSSTSLFMSSRQQTGRDFYRILGINRNADLKEIKTAFRGMAKLYHPGALRCVSFRCVAFPFVTFVLSIVRWGVQLIN